MSNELALIQACKYLYLNELTEQSDNELRIVFAEAMTGELADPRTIPATTQARCSTGV
jgi:hypothetical protein